MSWCSEILDIEHLLETWLLPALNNAIDVFDEIDSLSYVERFNQLEEIQRAFQELKERFEKACKRKNALQNKYYCHFISLAIFESFNAELSSYTNLIADYIESEISEGNALQFLQWPHDFLVREFLQFTRVSANVNLAYIRENKADPVKLKRIK